MSYLEENDVFDELRTYFSTTEWNQLASTVKTRYLNIMKNHLFKLSMGLRSVAPDFMTMDRSRETSQGKVSLPSPGQEDVPEEKDDEEWTLHLSRGHIETVAVYPSDRTLRKLPRLDYTEPELLEHRVNKTLPQRFDIRQSHIPDTGLGVFYYGYSELPVGTHFGPYEGLKTDDLYCQILRSGQIQPCQQLTFSVASQKQGDTDEPRSYSLPFNKTLTQLTYTGKKAQICKQCDRSFNHMEKHQCVLTGEKPFSCNQCAKSFSKLSNLNRHQRVHTGNKPFLCKQCAKSFSQFVHLKKHERLHTGEKPFHCKQCDKCFSRLDSLKRHQQLHTGEKPFQCKQCDRRFSQLGVLKTHQRLHTGEKPFHCKQCDRRFSQLGTLKSHQRLHTGEKPFKCKQCGKSFSQLGVLNRHQRIHTERKNSLHRLNRLRISPL